jgi:signal transduction histidine kinase
MNLAHLLPSAVARHLIARLVIVGVGLGLAVSALQLIGDYQRRRGGLEQELEQISTSYLPSLIENVWLDDAERIDMLLDGIVRLPAIAKAEILGSSSTAFARGGEAVTPLIRTYPLARQYGGKSIDLGSLVVTADLADLRDKAIRQVLSSLAASSILLTVLGILLYLQVHRIMTGRISVIADQAERLGRLGPARAPPLDLGPSPPADELTALGEGLNRMQSELAEATAAVFVNEERYRELFARSPVSLWEEDFSEVHQTLEALRPTVSDLAAHLEAHPECVRHCAAQVRIVAVNDATIAMHRAKDEAELCSRLSAIFTPASFEAFKPQLLAIWHGETDIRVTGEVRTLEGDIRDVVVRWHVPPAHSARYDRVIVSQEDVTEMKAAHRSAEITMEKLMQAKAELERFTFVASHDLREPIRSVISFSQLLERSMTAEENISPEVSEYLAYLKAAANRMQAQVTGLYDYSRAGQAPERFQPVDLVLPLNDARRMLKDSLEQADASLEFHSLPVVSGNRPLLAELFRHLLDNSIKFRRPDLAPVITVSATQAGEFWKITVRDNGIGVDPLYAAGIFDVFRRLHGPAQFPGAGLGLSICRRIIDSHGGHISIDTGITDGTAIILLLPATLASTQEQL